MSLSILTSPSSTSSVSNEMLFIINESVKANDPANYPNYKYVLDIYVNSALVARMKATPDPTHYFGIFDVSKILQNYVPAYAFKIDADIKDYDVRLAYQVKLGEEYSDTLYTNLLTDSTRYCFKSYKSRPFSSTSVMANGMASSMPSPVNVYTPSDFKIVPFFSNVSGVTDLTATFKDVNGNTLATAVFSNADYVANTIRQYNIENSSALVSYVLLTGCLTQRLNYSCSKHTNFTIVWLNHFGAYDSQDFWLVSKKTISVEKKSYERLPYDISVSGVVSYNDAGSVFYGSKREFASTVKTRLHLTSHLLNEDEYNWIAEMFISPNVYIYLTGIGFVPISIKGDYEYRNYLNSRLIPLEFDVEFSEDYNAQNL